VATDPNVIMGTTSTVRTLADGGMKITIDIAPADMKRAFSLFGDGGTAIGMVPLTIETKQKQAQQHAVAEADQDDGVHGKHYTLLYRNGWWNNPRVRRAMGFAGPVEADEMKAYLYKLLGVTSLSQVPPERFRAAMRNAAIADTLPRGFGE
jgi:hypothetical protein